jgi:hypothetical protein
VGWTERDYANYMKRKGVAGAPNNTDVSRQPFRHAGHARRALGRLPTGTMNKLETKFSEHLKTLEHSGEILWWKFEGVKLRLADKTFLTVDFASMGSDGLLTMWECKGFMEDDAAVKLKVAAATYPFRFVLVTKGKAGLWNFREM